MLSFKEGSSTERTVAAEDNPVTPTLSSAPASGRLRRSRIKPTVVPVARTRAKAVKNSPPQGSKGGKETDLSDAQECTVSGKEDQHLDDDLQGNEGLFVLFIIIIVNIDLHIKIFTYFDTEHGYILNCSAILAQMQQKKLLW